MLTEWSTFESWVFWRSKTSSAECSRWKNPGRSNGSNFKNYWIFKFHKEVNTPIFGETNIEVRKKNNIQRKINGTVIWNRQTSVISTLNTEGVFTKLNDCFIREKVALVLDTPFHTCKLSRNSLENPKRQLYLLKVTAWINYSSEWFPFYSWENCSIRPVFDDSAFKEKSGRYTAAQFFPQHSIHRVNCTGRYTVVFFLRKCN